MTRKSPIKHHVRKHRRSNTVVTDYDRGKGKKPQNITKPSFSSPRSNPYNFTVIIKYVGASSETFPVRAIGIPEAVYNAMLSRTRTETPSEVEVLTK